MNSQLQKRLDKVFALINQGATDGEKAAAKAALDRIVDNHNLHGQVNVADSSIERSFLYKGMIEIYLMQELMAHFNIDVYNGKRTRSRIYMDMNYLDFIQIDCAFSYFRVHMRDQWNKTCLPLINRKRTARSKKATRDQLVQVFIPAYCDKSGIGTWTKTSRETHKMNKAEMDAALATLMVEGGKFHNQVSTDSPKLLNQ